MATEDFDYTEEVSIDPYNLDQEWLRHSQLVLKYNEALAEARRDMDLAKEDVDLSEAEADNEIREQSEKKPPEDAIKKLIVAHPKVQEARRALVEAKFVFGKLQAGCSAIDAKGKALENLVKLHLNQYYAEPTADIEARGVIDGVKAKAAKDRVVIGGKNPAKSEENGAKMTRRK